MATPMRLGSTVAAAALILAGGAAVMPAEAHQSGIHDNCTKFNNRFAHGVGTRRAHDHTSGTPVTNFRRSNRIYWRAERHNPDLDRDNDRVACEKA